MFLLGCDGNALAVHVHHEPNRLIHCLILINCISHLIQFFELELRLIDAHLDELTPCGKL
jgi:hypothetical protein